MRSTSIFELQNKVKRDEKDCATTMNCGILNSFFSFTLRQYFL